MTKRTIEEVLTDLIGKKYLEGADFKRNELIDDQLSKVPEALKEIHDLILESLPKEKKIETFNIRTNTGEVFENQTDDIGGSMYNKALSDTKANLLNYLGGRENEYI